MMVTMGKRGRLNEWADQREIDGPPTPRWLVWVTATWPRTAGLAVLVGAWGFVRTAVGSDGWGLGDEISGLLGGIGAALFIRVVVRRRERLRRDAADRPSPVASSAD